MLDRARCSASLQVQEVAPARPRAVVISIPRADRPHRRVRRRALAARALTLTAWGWAWAPPQARAAFQSASPDTVPVATLSVWANDVWLDLLDREGTMRGPLAEEGIFQRFHERMDAEYALDVRTGLFSAAEDARWAVSGDGIRAATSSISHPHVLNHLEWRQRFSVSGSLGLLADYRRDHSFTDRRDHTRLGLSWTDEGRWTVWSRIGVHFFKPAADLEVGATRTWPLDAGNSWLLEVRIAALDVFSDLVFVRLGVDPLDVEAQLDHAGLPLAARAFLERRARRWRLELHGGGSTVVQSRVSFPSGAKAPFDLTERVGFAGALLEVTPAKGLSVAGYGRVARALTRHDYPWWSAPSLRIVERTEAAGAHLRQRLAPDLALEAELHGVWRPEARLLGPGSVRHRDRELYGALALVRRSDSGWTGQLRYAWLDRQAGVLLPDVGGFNHRLVTEAGYRTAAGFEVSGGFRWDLDELGGHTFDGAQLRLSVMPAGSGLP